MKYLNCVIKETLRFMTPVTHTRRAVNKDIKLGGKTLRKGTAGVVMLSEIHRDERYSPEPNSFKPERFHNFKQAIDGADNSYIYLPFSAMCTYVKQKFF